MSMKIDATVALVTGANRGIGRAIAVALAVVGLVLVALGTRALRRADRDQAAA